MRPTFEEQILMNEELKIMGMECDKGERASKTYKDFSFKVMSDYFNNKRMKQYLIHDLLNDVLAEFQPRNYN